MAAKINWHRYGTELRHCHLMYKITPRFHCRILLPRMTTSYACRCFFCASVDIPSTYRGLATSGITAQEHLAYLQGAPKIPV